MVNIEIHTIIEELSCLLDLFNYDFLSVEYLETEILR